MVTGRCAREPAILAKKAVSAFDPKTFLATVSHGRQISKYAKNAVVFQQGGPADAVFYIQEGRIKLMIESEQGKEAVVAILGPGEFFGEGCLIGQPLRLATARAMVERAGELVRVASGRRSHADCGLLGTRTAILMVGG